VQAESDRGQACAEERRLGALFLYFTLLQKKKTTLRTFIQNARLLAMFCYSLFIFQILLLAQCIISFIDRNSNKLIKFCEFCFSSDYKSELLIS
jgi:hypothetical protein